MSAVDLSQFNDGPGPNPQLDPQPYVVPPGTIRLKSGSEFKVSEAGNIQWHPKGVFATGSFGLGSDAVEEDVLFFDANIDYIKFDFGAVIDGEDSVD